MVGSFTLPDGREHGLQSQDVFVLIERELRAQGMGVSLISKPAGEICVGKILNPIPVFLVCKTHCYLNMDSIRNITVFKWLKSGT